MKIFILSDNLSIICANCRDNLSTHADKRLFSCKSTKIVDESTKFHVFRNFAENIIIEQTMSIVKIKDKSFKTSIPEAEILKKVQVVADRINQDYAGKKPVFLAVLNGAFIFAADLMRMITIPSEISL